MRLPHHAIPVSMPRSVREAWLFPVHGSHGLECGATVYRAIEAFMEFREHRTCLFAAPGTPRIPLPWYPVPLAFAVLQGCGDVGRVDAVDMVQVGDGAVNLGLSHSRWASQHSAERNRAQPIMWKTWADEWTTCLDSVVV